MTTEHLVQEYLANGGEITKCPPANAKGNEASKATKEEVAEQRKAWKQANKTN